MATHNFGERKEESFKGKKLPVWQTPKYEASRAKAIEVIEKGDYGLADSDFWILMNTYSNETGMMYTGLIMSHNACLKINDKLESPFQAQFMTREWIGESLVYEYNDGILYEVGEVSPKNCKNNYPYAMAFKRCFDRVVLKKSKLAYAGIYSDSEAEEFKEKYKEPEEVNPTISKYEWELLNKSFSKDEIKAMYSELGITKGTDIPLEYYTKKMKEKEEKDKQGILAESAEGFY